MAAVARPEVGNLSAGSARLWEDSVRVGVRLAFRWTDGLDRTTWTQPLRSADRGHDWDMLHL